VNGNCLFDLGPGCCYEDSDCDDNDDVCTVDICVDNHCEYELEDEDEIDCCFQAEDCTAIDPCLEPFCKENHQCDYGPIPDCCKENVECDDGDDLCTVDLCVNNECEYELSGEEGCCLSDDGCDSDDICLEPFCGEDHLCFVEPVVNCCHDDTECDDGDDLCTDDSCVDAQCEFTPTGAEGCCEKDSDCVNPDPCLAGKCNTETTTCSYEPIEGCCHNDGECDDEDDLCTDDTCVDNECVFTPTGAEGCCEEFTWEKDFDDGSPQGFTIVNSMDFGGFVPGWQVSDQCGASSSPFAMYYGVLPGMLNPSCAVAGLLPVPGEGTITSQSIELPEGQTYTLKFAIMADVNADDKLFLEVISGNTTKVWDKTDLSGLGPIWHEVSLDFSDFAGKSIQIRYSFVGALMAMGSGLGALLDDLSLTADCNP